MSWNSSPSSKQSGRIPCELSERLFGRLSDTRSTRHQLLPTEKFDQENLARVPIDALMTVMAPVAIGADAEIIIQPAATVPCRSRTQSELTVRGTGCLLKLRYRALWGAR